MSITMLERIYSWECSEEVRDRYLKAHTFGEKRIRRINKKIKKFTKHLEFITDFPTEIISLIVKYIFQNKHYHQN